MYKVLVNKAVKFQINITNGCWENSKSCTCTHYDQWMLQVTSEIN